MDVILVVVKFFADGGFFMYPILFILAIGTAISIERYTTLSLMIKRNAESWKKLEPLIMRGDFHAARELASKDTSTIAQILSMGLARQGAVRRRDDIELAAPSLPPTPHARPAAVLTVPLAPPQSPA